MNRTFTVMKLNVGTEVGDSSTAMLNLIGGYLNNRLSEVMKRCNLIDNIRSDYQFTTTAGTEDYILPQDFGKEISVRDATNKQNLTRRDIQATVASDPYSTDDTGSVCQYTIFDKTVRNQPTASSVITFVSSSASDTSQICYVKGFDANGYEDYETVTLNGTTPVATSKSFTRILLIAKSAVTTGVISVTSNTGAVSVAVMSRAMLEHRIKLMRLSNIPNSAITVEINYIQKPVPMSQEYDYPLIDCADVLEAGALADAWRFKRQFAKAADLDIVFEKRLANLLFDSENQPNKVNLFRPQTYRSHQDSGIVTDARYGVF